MAEKITRLATETEGTFRRRRECEERFQAALRDMGDQRDKWRDDERVYWNEDTFPARFKHLTQIKIARPLSNIETQMAQFSDFLPTVDYLPKQSANREMVDVLQARKDQLLRDAHFRERSLQAVRDAQIYGLGLIEVFPRLIPSGTTDVLRLQSLDFRPTDPFTFLPSSDATSLDLEKTEFICFGVPQNLARIRRTWKGAAKDIAADQEVGRFRAFGDQGKKAKSKKPDEGPGQQALVKECYWMDEEGKIQAHIWAGNTTLLDSMREGHKNSEGDLIDERYTLPRLHYFDIANYRTAHTLFGYSEARMLGGLYRATNRIFTQLSNWVQKFGSPALKGKHSFWNALTRPLQHTPGEPVRVNGMGDVEWMNPPAMPAEAFSILQWAKSSGEDITGVFESIQGRLPSSDASGRAVLALQEASLAKIRLKNATWVTSYMEDVGGFIFEIQRRYDRYPFEVQQDGEDGIEFKQMDLSDLPPDFEVDVRVTAGTKLPAGRAATEARALELAEKGYFGPEDVFEALDIDDRTEKLKRFKERQGILAMEERHEAIVEAQEQLRKWADASIEDPEGFSADRDSDHLVELIQQFPELMATSDFQAMDAETKMLVAAQAFAAPQSLSEAAG